MPSRMQDARFAVAAASRPGALRRHASAVFIMGAVAAWIVAPAAAFAAEFPAWAFPIPVEGSVPRVDGARHVAGSGLSFTQAQIDTTLGGFPDWFPSEHPAMPPVVAKGRPPAVWACAYCHLANGAGRPENAALAGLPPRYIAQQVANFRSGARRGSGPPRDPLTLMIGMAKAMTDDEAAQAAGYFASLRPQSFVTVVESATAPKSRVAGSMMAKAPEGGTEPIGSRIVEVPEDLGRAENRDPNTPYLAFVPPGSLKEGAALVLTGGGGRTLQCSICHGPGLKGMGDIPRITGRSPSYTMRQLYDIRAGNRRGAAAMMTVAVARLSDNDMIAISAYLASLAP